MKSYIEILTKMISQVLNERKDFYLVKLENFTTPEIYYKICLNLKQNLKNEEIEFIAKLSLEKYEEWKKENKYYDFLDLLDTNNWIEKQEHLTKWRNYSFTGTRKRSIIILMGTESVEDQGGLSEFFTISPESIENYILNNYCMLMGNSFTDDSIKTINNIFSNIFIYAEKDLLKLSYYFEKSTSFSDLDLINNILSNLFTWWNLPNINNGLSCISNKQLESGKIDLIEKGYKFSRRIGFDLYQRESKINDISARLDEFFADPLETKQSINEDLGYYYSDYVRFKNDLISYLKGIDIDKVKNNLFTVNFDFINKLLKITKRKPKPNKPTKITGDPFEALSLPILQEIEELDEKEKRDITEIIIRVERISLSKTKMFDENEVGDKHSMLVTKWYSFVYFLQGIEELLIRQNLTNLNDDDIGISIVFEDINGILNYPFNKENTKDLDDAGILVCAKDSESNSKISLTYDFKINEKIQRAKYDWIISEQDNWIHVFNFFNDTKFIAHLKNDYEFLPLCYSKDFDYLIGANNSEEFYYYLDTIQAEYINALEIIENNSELFLYSTKLAKSFTNFLNNIKSKGFFGAVFKTYSVTEFLNVYSEFVEYCADLLKKDKRENYDVNILTKSFLMLNSDNYNNKYIKGAIVPLYHPVMLEKVVERYSYLSNAFKELYDNVINSDGGNSKSIKRAFDRFNQLATIVFSASVLLGDNNTLINCKNSFGFFNIYGNENLQNELLGSNISYMDIDYEEDEKVTLSSTPISNYISSVVKEYLNTYPSKIDGFTISFIKPLSYSDIISGLNDILKRLKQELDYKIKINLIVYTDEFRAAGSKYLSNWIEGNFTEDDNIVLESYIKLLNYDNIDIDTIEHYFNRTIEQSDIIFFNDIMHVTEIIPEAVQGIKINKIENRYPTVYLPVKCHEDSYRKLNITQTQFTCEYKHVQFMVFYKDLNSCDTNYQIIKKVGISDEDYILLEKIHEKSNWVVILDENIDAKIINISNNKVIGFSTGEGYFGELNATVSSRDVIIKDLHRLMKKRLANKFSTWSNSQINYAASSCMEMTQLLDGAQILKALNPDDEAINSYLAYLMTYKLELSKEFKEDCMLRKIISLDSYNHLFDDLIDFNKADSSKLMPDLLVLELYKDDINERYKVNAKIIECKLTSYSNSSIEEAKLQVQAGYNHLFSIWNPDSNSVQRRFWLNQLYRILTYSGSNEINHKYSEGIVNLTDICEGNFSIEFLKEIYMFWLDRDEDEIIEVTSGDTKSIIEKHISQKVMKKLLLDGYEEVNKDSIKQEGYDTENDLYIEPKVAEGTDNNQLVINKRSTDDIINDKNDLEKVTKSMENIVDHELVNIFNDYKNEELINESIEIQEKFNTLKNILQVKKVNIIQKGFIIGPDIVRYEFDLDYKTDVKDITKNQDNIQLKLKLNEPPFIFIEDGLIKMDTARKNRQTIGLKTMLNKINENARNEIANDLKKHFYILIGADVLGQPYLLDLSDSNSPHLLIAGQTGSGKSVLLSSILASIMCFYTPDDVEMVLVDPKRVELTAFKESPFTKLIATDTDKAIKLLTELLSSMEERYKIFEKEGVKNINEYNIKCPEKKLKRILMVFDEYASMMMADKEFVKIIESTIVRLSQEARAAGIHLIICTQSPKADIITTTIRNNLNARIGLKVTDAVASKVILDESGAETLLGKGDMFLKTANSPKLIRIKSPFITNEELQNLISYFNK